MNHRYFDLKLRSGPLDPALEERLVAALRKRAERGSFTVTVRDEGVGGAAAARIDMDLARSVYAALDELRRALGLADAPTLAQVVSQPGVLQLGEPAGEHEVVVTAAEAAAEALVQMRRREGETLGRDLGQRLDRLLALADEIEGIARSAPEEQGKRLHERVQRLLAGATPSAAPPGTPAQGPVAPVVVDEARLAQEIAVLADKLDVTEELVRLRSHIDQVRSLLQKDTPVGRRLDFLVQELGREVNTIGSKSQSAEIARRVVEAKAELERVREQVQNVE